MATKLERSPDEWSGAGPGATVEALLRDNERLKTEIMRMAAEREQLQARLVQSRALEAVGRLTAGVAHDFNNLVTVISGYSQLLLRRLSPGDALRASVEGIQGAAEWGATLTRQLLAACRHDDAPACLVSVNDVVAGAEPMLRLLIGEPYELLTRLDPEAGPVQTSLGRLEQIITNLVANARDALGERGRVTISTEAMDVDDSQAAQLGLPRRGRYVVLAVSDTGSGMEAATQGGLFEPYVTTKQPGKGIGLGLAAVYEAVNRGGGAIRVVSGAGAGSTFEVYLPGLDETPRGETPSMADRDPLDGTETVLVVEDERPVRELIRDVLRLHGYTVLEATDATQALELAARHAGPIHLVVVDVVIPGISSAQMLEELRATRPALRVLHTSGHTDELLREHGVVRGAAHFLQKPFTVDALAHIARQILDEP